MVFSNCLKVLLFGMASLHGMEELSGNLEATHCITKLSDAVILFLYYSANECYTFLLYF